MKYRPKNKTQAFILGAATAISGIFGTNYIMNKLYENRVPKTDNYLFNMAIVYSENTTYFTDLHRTVKKGDKGEVLWLLENILRTKKGEGISLRRASGLTCITDYCKEGVENLTEASLETIEESLKDSSK